MSESPIPVLFVSLGIQLSAAVGQIVVVGLLAGAPIFAVFLVFRFFKRLIR